jgi:cysteine synthase B
MLSNASILDRAPGSSVLDMIGRTPLVRLHQFERETPGVELYAKAEWQNPGGSVKDRAAARMILEGEASGALTPDKTILDATSGNTGIAYAMVGAARGYKVTLCLPENASPERKLILRALGAELILTSPLEATDGAIREARQLAASDPERYFYPDQYSNDANWRAHYDTTAPEIIEQTSGRLTHFVAGLGTSGTFVGTGRRLRKFNPGIKLISFQPDAAFHGLEGWTPQSCPVFTTRRWPTRICASTPNMRTGWCGVWRGKRGCWPGYPPAPRWSRCSTSPGV